MDFGWQKSFELGNQREKAASRRGGEARPRARRRPRTFKRKMVKAEEAQESGKSINSVAVERPRRSYGSVDIGEGAILKSAAHTAVPVVSAAAGANGSGGADVGGKGHGGGLDSAHVDGLKDVDGCFDSTASW